MTFCFPCTGIFHWITIFFGGMKVENRKMTNTRCYYLLYVYTCAALLYLEDVLMH